MIQQHHRKGNMIQRSDTLCYIQRGPDLPSTPAVLVHPVPPRSECLDKQFTVHCSTEKQCPGQQTQYTSAARANRTHSVPSQMLAAMESMNSKGSPALYWLLLGLPCPPAFAPIGAIHQMGDQPAACEQCPHLQAAVPSDREVVTWRGPPIPQANHRRPKLTPWGTHKQPKWAGGGAHSPHPSCIEYLVVSATIYRTICLRNGMTYEDTTVSTGATENQLYTISTTVGSVASRIHRAPATTLPQHPRPGPRTPHTSFTAQSLPPRCPKHPVNEPRIHWIRDPQSPCEGSSTAATARA